MCRLKGLIVFVRLEEGAGEQRDGDTDEQRGAGGHAVQLYLARLVRGYLAVLVPVFGDACPLVRVDHLAR